MRVIYKYQIPVCEKHVIELPIDSQIIRVEDVDGYFYLWAIIDNKQTELEKRYLELYKTGQEISDSSKLDYLGFCKIFIGMELGLYVFENVTMRGNE